MRRHTLRLFACALSYFTIATTARAIDTHTLNVSLVPGDVLYVRFKLDNPGQLPGDFNYVGTDFYYTAATPSATTRTDIYDQMNMSVGHFDSVANFPHFGIGPEFIDPTLSNPVSNFCCGRAVADLSSYLDGEGMASLHYQAGPGVTVATFRALFGNAYDGGSGAPLLDTTILYSVNSIPPAFVPEPTSLGLCLLACSFPFAMKRRRTVC